jgi:hypothetical protein
MLLLQKAPYVYKHEPTAATHLRQGHCANGLGSHSTRLLAAIAVQFGGVAGGAVDAAAHVPAVTPAFVAVHLGGLRNGGRALCLALPEAVVGLAVLAPAPGKGKAAQQAYYDIEHADIICWRMSARPPPRGRLRIVGSTRQMK